MAPFPTDFTAPSREELERRIKQLVICVDRGVELADRIIECADELPKGIVNRANTFRDAFAQLAEVAE